MPPIVRRLVFLSMNSVYRLSKSDIARPRAASPQQSAASLTVFRRVANEIDDAGKIARAVARRRVLVVNFRRMSADRGLDLRGLCGFARKLEILQHQGRGESWLVGVIGGASRHRTGHRTIARQRPALARACRGDVEQRLMREPELLAENEGFADRDHRGAEDH